MAVRSTLRRLLQAAGIPKERLHEAEEAREGLRLFREASPDLVFLDLGLGAVPGEEVGELMLAERPEARLALITALDPGDERVRFLVSKGASDVIPKPVDPDRVRALVDGLDAASGALGRVDHAQAHAEA